MRISDWSSDVCSSDLADRGGGPCDPRRQHHRRPPPLLHRRSVRQPDRIHGQDRARMSFNSFGRVLRFTTWGESHGPALGAVVDGCPPRLSLSEADVQPYLDKRRPGQSRHTTQRQEPDQVRILSGVFEGKTTGTPISLMIENVDQRSKDYGAIAEAYRPGHADYAYDAKYGIRDYRGGGRSSARETAARVAAGGVARLVIPEVQIHAWRSEEHTSELQSLMRNSYAVFCLKKQK